MTANPVHASHLTYRPDIDGLRALAVLAVVAFHVAPMRVSGGFVGVDVFFVISGFLISSLLITGLNKGTFSYTDFYVRRIRRIFPALIAVFLFCLFAGWLLLLPDEYSQLGKHIVAGSLFTSNFALWGEAGYFDVASAKKPLLHLWSLGIEEQFYIAWPLVLAVLWRSTRGRVAWILAGLVLSLLICWVLAYTAPTAAFFLPFARFWQLLVGAALAAAFATGTMPQLLNADESALGDGRSRAWIVHTCAWIGVALVVGTIALVDDRSVYPWLRAVVPTLGTAMIIAAGPQAHVNKYIFAHPWVVFVGLISYPLYLWHWPLLSMLDIVQPPGPVRIYKVAAVAAAVLLAIGTYHFIEKRVRTPPYVRVRWLVFSCVVCLVAGVAVLARSGFADARGPWGIRSMPDRFETAQMQTPACIESFATAFYPRLIRERDFCIKTRPGIDDVVVLGDSHANRLYFGLRDLDPQRRYVNLGRGTCIPFLGFDAAWPDTGEELICESTGEALLERSIASGARTIVVHGFFVRAYTGGLQLSGKRGIGEQARRTLTRLSASGLKTVLVLDVPVLPFEPSACIARPLLKSMVVSPCEFSAEAWQKQVAATNAALREAAAGLPNVTVFDPTAVLCNDRICRGERNGELLYLDSHHLSAAGVALVADELLRVLNPAPLNSAEPIVSQPTAGSM